MRFLDPEWLILVSVRWALIVCFLSLLFVGHFRLEMGSRRGLSAAERASDRRLARVRQRERNRLTPVEFLGGTVLGSWCGLRRRLSAVERATDRRLARVRQPATAGKRERNRLTPVEFLGGTVLGIWYGLRRRLSDAERASDRRLARADRPATAGKRER